MPNTVMPITATNLPIPKGHYSHATRFGELVYISGQLPIRADGEPTGPSFAEQAEIALSNLLAIVEAAGGEPADLLKVTIYLVGIEHWDAFNSIYARLMGAAKPARAVVPVPHLHFGYLIEVEAVAAIALDRSTPDF